MDAGPLRQRVTIQTLTESRDSYGQQVESWVSFASGQPDGAFAASIRQLAGREAVNAKQVKADTTHLVEMRYVASLFPGAGLLPSMRMLFNGAVFNVLYVDNVDNRNRTYRIYAQEIVSPLP